MDHHFDNKKIKKASKIKRNRKISKTKKPSDDSVDLEEDIHPIGHYLNDKQEMINQVFAVMEREKLKSMLPPILKGMMMDELKEKCLTELQGMSDVEISRILTGQPIITPLKDGSDAGSSFSLQASSERERESKTLLDILEQEMQMIAYQTVLRKEEHISSTRELSHKASLSPTSTIDLEVISSSDSSVEIVCLDSANESPNSLSRENNTVFEEPENGSQEVIKSVKHGSICEVRFSGISEMTLVSSSRDALCQAALSTDTNSATDTAPVLEEAALPIVHSAQMDNIIPSEESFLIQVFPGKRSDSERIVKKVSKALHGVKSCELECCSNDCQRLGDENTDQSSNVPSCQSSEKSRSSPSVISISTEEPLPASLSNMEQNSFILNYSPNPQSNSGAPMETSEVTVHDLDVTKECTDSSNKLLEGKAQESITLGIIEKEEGEITGGETDDDPELIEVGQDNHRSPTICLSSDDNRHLSELENGSKNIKRHRHRHHRHKKFRSDLESPERSKRQIDQRGTRRYRRKKCLNPKSKGQDKIVIDTPELEDLEKVPLNVHSGTTRIFECDAAISNAVEEQDNLNDIENDNISCKSESSIKQQHQQDHVSCTSSDTDEIVLDCSSSQLGENTEEENSVDSLVATNASWADRWAEKKDLKRVVITSKIYTNVRKRILSAQRKKKNEENGASEAVPLPSVPHVLQLEGSVQEYQMLQWIANEGENKVNVSEPDQRVRAKECLHTEGSENDYIRSISKEGSKELNEASAFSHVNINDDKSVHSESEHSFTKSVGCRRFQDPSEMTSIVEGSDSSNQLLHVTVDS